MGKKKGPSKSSDQTPSSKSKTVFSEGEKPDASERKKHDALEGEKPNASDKKVTAEKIKLGAKKKNSGDSMMIRHLKPFALGAILSLLGCVAFSAYQNVSPDEVRDVIHKNLDSLLGSEKLDRMLDLVFSKTIVTEMQTIDGDNDKTDHVIGADSQTPETDDRGGDKKDSTADGKDGKHVTDDRKVGDDLRQPLSESVKEDMPLPQTIDESSKKKKTPKPNYLKADITNKADNRIRSELDQADEALEKSKVEEAVSLYDAIISRYPQSPRAFYGKACALNKMAEEKKSNTILEQAISEFLSVLSLPDVPKSLAIKTAKTCAERQSFRGWSGKAIKTLQQVISIYPDEKELWNDLGVRFLLTSRVEDARQAFKKVLAADASDGFAMVHLGFIIKTTDKNYEGSIPYMREGIASNAPGVIDGRFFFHLGDALFRVGQHNESHEVYRLGAEKGLFMSTYQRSLYNVNGLAARPWWTKAQTGNAKFLTKLEENWETIRDEGVANLDESRGVFQLEDEDLREEGDWRQFTLYQQGKKIEENCRKVPKTCALLEGFTEAIGCKRGQIKYSVMQPGVHVWPHCGPTNCRIRAHLGLIIPDGPRIRVANDTQTWKLGKFILFDDSFEHEVWHTGSSLRLVLILDMWHPELTSYQKQTLSPI